VLDEKVLAVAVSSPLHKEVHRHTDLFPHVLREIEHFFAIYKELEGKHTEVRGWRDAGQAKKLVMKCHQRFGESEGKRRSDA
jgi:inorganic pyrophosphatase